MASANEFQKFMKKLGNGFNTCISKIKKNLEMTLICKLENLKKKLGNGFSV